MTRHQARHVVKKWGYRYLQEIEQYRKENRDIFYLDETWFDTHETVKKGWTDGTRRCILNIPPSKGKRISILHAGSKNGFVLDALHLGCKNLKDANADYHSDMTAEVFEKWFTEILIPKLPKGSIIVLDNASYHSVQIDKVPNSSSRKEEIQEFLIKKDLFFEETYTKNELLEVVRTKSYKKNYKIDQVASE